MRLWRRVAQETGSGRFRPGADPGYGDSDVRRRVCDMYAFHIASMRMKNVYKL